jgi:DNA polymerase-3 subunit alpha
MVDDYVSRKHGLTKVEYLVPELEELTAETLGVIVYQDQVLQIANRLAGYSLGEADLLRRAMGKKKPEEMAKHAERFVEGATRNGIDPRKSDEIFRLMAEFAGYGFPKAHSTAYALITYQTAYLKANHPREFLAALLSIEAGNHDKLSRYIAHARARKIEVLPPDVNESERDFTVVAEGIRFGLAGVKNVGEGAIEAIVAERGAGGRFASLPDFAGRVDAKRVNRRVVESLVRCGAFDSVHPNRAAVWGALDAALEAGAAAQRDRDIGQSSLFGGTAAAQHAGALPDAPPWTEQERLAHEKEVLGFYVTGHPLDAWAADLARFTDASATTAAERAGREVRIGGLLTGLRETRTRRGATMAFATLEDLEGSFELVVFAEPFARLRPLLKESVAPPPGQTPVPLVLAGTLEGGDPPKLLVRDAFRLPEAAQKLSAQVRVRILDREATRDRLLALRRVLDAHSGDCGLLLHLVIPGESETVVALPNGRGVEPSDGLLREIDTLFGRAVADRLL